MSDSGSPPAPDSIPSGEPRANPSEEGPPDGIGIDIAKSAIRLLLFKSIYSYPSPLRPRFALGCLAAAQASQAS